MKVNSILGLAAVAGAAYFLQTEKGRGFINQSREAASDLFDKGKVAYSDISKTISDKFNTWRGQTETMVPEPTA